jgi:hypothetical protein
MQHIINTLKYREEVLAQIRQALRVEPSLTISKPASIVDVKLNNFGGLMVK